jgi:hypothetical protein
VLTPLQLLLSPQQLLATPRKLLALSLPARAAVLLAIFLVLATLVVFVQALRTGEVWQQYLSVVLVLTTLSVIIPIVAYQTLKLWLEGETSAFEDIDRAWQAGLKELERSGSDLTRLPLFLVIGSPSEFLERALFDAAKLSLTVRQFPEGDNALHWYATSDAIYLVATKVGCLSKAAANGDRVLELDRKRKLAPEAASPAEPRPIRDLRMTVGGNEPDLRESLAAVAGGGHSLGGGYRGTMEIRSTDEIRGSGMLPTGDRLVAQRERIHLSHDDWQQEPKRLRYLCRLLRRARLPFCPINGALALLPYAVVQRGDEDAAELQKAARADFTTLGQELRLRFPVLALMTGMESEDGFCELIRRIGGERAMRQRFGKGFLAWDENSPEQLGALCIHACGAFETFIYEMFKEKGALAGDDKALGNRKLYSLLCQVRRDFQKRLDGILVRGFTQDEETEGNASPLLFGGCYFSATGDTLSSRGFVRGVLRDRLTDPEERDGPLYENLEWSASMLREDAWYRRLAFAGFVIDAVLLVITLVIVIRAW